MEATNEAKADKVLAFLDAVFAAETEIEKARERGVEAALLMDNGLAPTGWVEVQADDETDTHESDEAAGAFLSARACLYATTTGLMALVSDHEACDILAGTVSDEDPEPRLIVIIPREDAVAIHGEENVP